MLGYVLTSQPTVILRVPSSGERRTLGYVHNRQPTVILREFQRGEKVNAWICAPQSTNHDPALDKNLDHLHYCIFTYGAATLHPKSNLPGYRRKRRSTLMIVKSIKNHEN